MGMFGVAVGNNHLGKRKTVENWSHNTLISISDVVEDNSLLVIESYVNLPVLPVDGPTLDLERYTFWLGDVDWLNVSSVTTFGFDTGGMIVVWFLGIDWTADFWDVNVHNLLGIGIKDGTEIKRERVLTVVLVGAIVHESLLKSDIAAESFVITDRPS